MERYSHILIKLKADSINFLRKILDFIDSTYKELNSYKIMVQLGTQNKKNRRCSDLMTHIDQNLAEFSLKTRKNSQFSLKKFNFSKFSAPSAPKIWSFIPQKIPIFLELGPPGAGVSPQIQL